MKLEGYDVTEQEINEYISTLDLQSLKLNLKVINKREVYNDNVLWYITNVDTTSEEEIQKQLDNRIYCLCGIYFSDKKIDDEIDTTPEPEYQPTNAEIAQTQLTMMVTMADQYEQNLQNQLTNMEVQATIYETLLEVQGGIKV